MGRDYREAVWGWLTVLNRVVREGLTVRDTEQRQAGSRESFLIRKWQEPVSEARACLVWVQNGSKALELERSEQEGKS